MVKLKGPGFSLAATGSLGNAITFSSNRGKPYLRKKVNTPNPRSDPQISTRAMFSFLSAAWDGLSQPSKDAWNELAVERNVSPFNAYMAFNTERWKNFLAPAQTPAALAVGTPSLRKFNYGEWTGIKFRLRTWSAAVNDGWGCLIHMGDTPTFTPTRNTVILVILDVNTDIQWIEWIPKIVRDRRFSSQPFSNDGYLGAVTGNYTVNV